MSKLILDQFINGLQDSWDNGLFLDKSEELRLFKEGKALYSKSFFV